VSGGATSQETERLVRKLRSWASKSRAADTFKKYRTPWRRWLEWAVARTKGGEPTPLIPAEPFHVALFLVRLAEEYSTAKTVVESAVTALNFVHRLNGFPEPYGHLAKAVSEGVRRERGGPVKKAKPLTIGILKKIVRGWGGTTSPLWQRMMAAMILLGFATFGRLGEVSRIKGGDIVFKRDHAQIFIEKSKTDQTRKGAWVLVARTGTELCPVTGLEEYMQSLGPGRDEPVFRTIWRRSLKNTGQESLGKTGISSSVYHRYFRRALQELAGMSEKAAAQYSGHSMRRGGATAAEMAQVPARLRMKHGRWISARTADEYIGDPRQTVLNVTRELGL
jgi:integrase